MPSGRERRGVAWSLEFYLPLILLSPSLPFYQFLRAELAKNTRIYYFLCLIFIYICHHVLCLPVCCMLKVRSLYAVGPMLRHWYCFYACVRQQRKRHDRSRRCMIPVLQCLNLCYWYAQLDALMPCSSMVALMPFYSVYLPCM